jgi:hypothetical protein
MFYTTKVKDNDIVENGDGTGYIKATGQSKQFEVPPDGIYLRATEDWSSADIIANPLTKTNHTERIQYEYKADRRVLTKLRAEYMGFLHLSKVMSGMNDAYETLEICEVFPQVVANYRERHIKWLAEDTNWRGMTVEQRRGTYHGNFSTTWESRSALQSVASLPAISTLSDLSNSVTHPQNTGGDRTKQEHFLEESLKKVGIFMKLLELARSNNPDDTRKAMVGIACNYSQYAENVGGWSNEHVVSVDGIDGVTAGVMRTEATINTNNTPLVSSKAFPSLSMAHVRYKMTTSSMHAYFTEVLKYVYADIIYKQVEVANGTIPSVTNAKYVILNDYLTTHTDIVTSRYLVAV